MNIISVENLKKYFGEVRAGFNSGIDGQAAGFDFR